MRRFLLCVLFGLAIVLTASTSHAQLSPPAAKPASGVTDTSFAASWGAVNGADAYLLDVSTSRTFTSLLPSYGGITVTDSSKTVSGLTSGVAYYYRVRATNTATKVVSTNSDTVTSITLPGFPFPLTTGAVGGKVVYSRQGNPNDTVWMAAGDGSFDTMMTVGAWPRLSHNGRYLAFHRGSDPNKTRQNLLVRDLQLDSEWTVFGNYDYLVNYCWTPNDSTLYFDFLCGMNYWRLNAAGTPGYFGVDCYDDAPSALDNAGTLAFQNYYQGIMLVDSGAANRRVLPNSHPHDYWPTWSPDGKWISFGRPAIDADYPNVVNYFKIRSDGSDLTQLTFLSGADTNKFMPTGAWTSDGRYLVAAGYLGGVHGIFTIPTDGSGNVRRLPISDGPAPDFVGTVMPGASPTGVATKTDKPTTFSLEQNYPNPFNPVTTIAYSIPGSRETGAGSMETKLVVYDILGREVSVLVNEKQEPGVHRVEFDGSRLASGVYIYRLTTGTSVASRRMVLVK